MSALHVCDIDSRRQFWPVVGAFGRSVVSHSDFLLAHVVKKGMCDKTPRTSVEEAKWREVKNAQEDGDREVGKIRE